MRHLNVLFLIATSVVYLTGCGKIDSLLLSSAKGLEVQNPQPVNASTQGNNLIISGKCSPDGAVISAPNLVEPATCTSGQFTAELKSDSLLEGLHKYPLSLTTSRGEVTTIEVPVLKKTTPPSGTLVPSWSEGQVFSLYTSPASNAVYLSGSCSEDTSLVQILNPEGQIRGTSSCAGGQWNSTVSLSDRTSGDLHLVANLIDSVGNKTTLTASTLSLDHTPPTGHVSTSPYSVSSYSTPNLTQAPVAGVCSADVAEITIWGDNGSLLGTSSCVADSFATTVDLSAYSQGLHSLHVVMKDAYGNSLSNVGPFVTIDTTPPTGTITSLWPSTISNHTTPSLANLPATGTCSLDTQTVVIKDIANQVLTTESCNAGTWSTNLNLSSYPEGLVQLKVELLDVVSNSLSLNFSNLVLDRLPPSGTITSTFPLGGVASAHTTPSNNAITLSGTCSADTSAITLRTSGGTVLETPSCNARVWSVTHDFSGIPDGTLNLEAILSDPWLNTLTLNFAPLTLKTAAPLGLLSFGSMGTSPSNDTSTRIVTINTPADVATLKYYIQYAATGPLPSCISVLADLQSQTPITAGGSSVDVSFPLTSGDGFYNICAIAGDAYGNFQELPVTSHSVEIDTNTSLSLNALQQSHYQNSVTFTGTCEAGSSVSINGDGTGLPATASCPAGTFSYLATLSAGEGNKTFSFTSQDLAGNTASASKTVIRDNTIIAPTWTLTNRPNTQVTAFFTAGSCGDVTAVYITESAGTPSLATAGWLPCSTTADNYSVDLSSGSDGLRTVRTFFRDEAGNISSVVLTSLILDTKPPQITFDAIPAALPVNLSNSFSWRITEANISSATNFTVDYYNGSSWSTIGTTPVGQNGPLSGRQIFYSYVIPNNPGPGKMLRVTVTDASGLTTVAVSPPFSAAADSTPPVVTTGTFLVNNSITPPTTYSNVVAVSLAATDTQTDIISYCIIESSTAPTNADSCWVALETYGVAPALNISTNAIKYNLGLPGSHTLYLFVRDRGLNISQLQASPQLGTDYVTINYVSDAPPVISNIQAANTENPDTPPRWDQLSVTNGDTIFVQWNATDNGSIASVDLLGSTDGVNFSEIAIGLSNGANAGCTIQSGYNGCTILSNPYAYEQSFRLQVKVYDNVGQMAVFTSPIFNGGNFRILGGNLDSGDGGDPRKAIFSPPYYEARASVNQMAVLTSGLILLKDPRGLVVVDPVQGKTYTLIRIADSGIPSGDGGPVSEATAGVIAKFAVDYLDNIWIYDRNRIRKIDTHATPWTISSIIGATDDGVLGTSTSDTILNPQDLNIANGIYNNQYGQQMVFAPNGDLYFSDFTTNNLIRVYRGSLTTPLIETIRASGTPTWSDGYSANVATLNMNDWALDFNSTTGALNNIWAIFNRPVVGDSYGYTARLSASGVVQQVYPFPYATNSYAFSAMSNMDGHLYVYNRFTYQGMMMLPRGEANWSRVLGDGSTKAVSADGSVANTSPVVADTIFIDRFSNIYFVERGIIRVVKNNKIYSLYGISKDSADGTPLLATRLNQTTSIDLGSGNRVIAYDYLNNKLVEFRPNETPSTRLLAGNGASGTTANGSAGPGNAMALGPWYANLTFASDPATGDVFRGCWDGTASRICRLDNASRTWYHLAAGATLWADATSSALSSFTFSYTALVGAFGVTGGGTKKLLVSGHTFIGAWDSQEIATKEVSNPYGAAYASHMIGNSGPQRKTGDFVDGAAGSSQAHRTLGVLDMPRSQYDPSDDQWIIAEQSGLAPLASDNRTILHKIKPGGAFQAYLTLDHLAVSFYSYGGAVYSCDVSGNLYKTITATGVRTSLSQPAGLHCSGTSMIMKPASGPLPARLVFPIISNGAQGIGEYKLP